MTTCKLTIKLPSQQHLKILSDFLVSFRYVGYNQVQGAFTEAGLTPVTVSRPDEDTVVMEPDMGYYDDDEDDEW